MPPTKSTRFENRRIPMEDFAYVSVTDDSLHVKNPGTGSRRLTFSSLLHTPLTRLAYRQT